MVVHFQRWTVLSVLLACSSEPPASSVSPAPTDAGSIIEVDAALPPHDAALVTGVRVSPNQAVMLGGTQLQFTATVTNGASETVRWRASAGSISSSGLLTAPPEAGSVVVTASLPTSTEAAATVTVLPAESLSDYDRIVLRDAPAAYWPHHDLASVGMDATGHGNSASYSHAPQAPQWVTLPNGDRAIAYNGIDQYLEVADADALSITHTGRFTIEVWMRPSSLEFASQESTGYVHFLGKGIPGQHEYALRMYSLTTSDVPPRPNRISGYAFNLDGGAGSGAYFQDAINTTAWNHVVIAFNTVDVTPSYTTGYVRIYRNGTARDTTPLTQFATIPQNGSAPLRIGTRNLSSFFTGAIGKVALYNSELTVTQVLSHRDVMCRKGCP